MVSEDLLDMEEQHEGFSAVPYICPAGYLTVGFGHNLDEPMSDHLARLILREDIKVAIRDLLTVLPDLDTYSTGRKHALTDMCFNMGLTTFRKFKKMIAYIKLDDWENVAKEAEHSDWYTQVGNRGIKIVGMLRKG